jgi:hypothetical protein
MREILEGPIPHETRATCDRCAMCNDVAPDAEAFNPRVKCCTYLPSLANFLVGRALDDDDGAAEQGRASLRARIEAGLAVTPLGLGRPASYALMYRHGGVRGFGRSEALLCPHYIDEQGGLCGIWRHRNAVCATWFCKHVRGNVGWAFWERLQQLLTGIEIDLARACVLELGLGERALANLFPMSSRGVETLSLDADDLDNRADPRAVDATWGAWKDRKIDFYRGCAAFVATLDFDGILARCGPETRIHIELVRAAWRKLTSNEAPARLRVGRLNVVQMSEEKCRVTVGSGTFEPLEMPRTLFDALHTFDGRPVKEARAAITRAGGPRLTDGLVRKLSDFGVLVTDGDDE